VFLHVKTPQHALWRADKVPEPCPNPALGLSHPQVNEALSDVLSETLDYSMRQELENVLRVGQRIAVAMVRWVATRPGMCPRSSSSLGQ
jgi:hypothetical protein